MSNLKFYLIGMGQARSPMTDFLIDCYFNGFYKGRKNFVSTPRYAKKKLRAMPHSAESIAHESGDPGVQLGEKKNQRSKIS
jgi:hypothetical protein